MTLYQVARSVPIGTGVIVADGRTLPLPRNSKLAASAVFAATTSTENALAEDASSLLAGGATYSVSGEATARSFAVTAAAFGRVADRVKYPNHATAAAARMIATPVIAHRCLRTHGCAGGDTAAGSSFAV